MGLKRVVKEFAYKVNNERYQEELAQRLVSYQKWVEELENGAEVSAGAQGRTVESHGQTTESQGWVAESWGQAAKPQGWIAESWGQTAESDKAWFVVLCNPRGVENVRARGWIADWFARCPETLMLYGDEDILDGDRTAPYFKPDWSPDLFDDRFYLGGLVAVRRAWLDECGEGLAERFAAMEQEEQSLRGTVVSEEDFLRCREESQRLVRRAVELAGGYEKGQGRRHIGHVPRILFHGENAESRETWMQYAEDVEGRNASGQYTNELEGRRTCDTLLSVIIPSKDNPDLLATCIRSIPKAADGLCYEVIVVDNGSGREEKEKVTACLEEIRRGGLEGLERVVYHYEPMEFNFSRMCNIGAEKAKGEQLLFLNDDVELVEQGCLRAMAGLAARPYVGAVGLKLLYPDGGIGQIQHAGITNLPMGPVHKLQFCRDGQDYYFHRNKGRHNVLAVTAACLMVEREKLCEAGGFAEELAVAFNDVDLCFRLYELGYENVCECDYYAFHDESYSRGDDEAPEKLGRLLAERKKLYERHPELEGKDPYYSVYLNRDGLDTRIRPLYETAGNRVQEIKKVENLEEIEAGSREEQRLKAWQDACLLVRVESALAGGENGRSLCLTGWSVVLGDNNACYDKFLVLKQETDMPKYYVTVCLGQYRPDLVENMPDQTNVGLCGYMVELKEGVLPKGVYQVGAVARNRVNNHAIANWSNRRINV
ncbi:MAG: glycosyltransferase [Butyrivibrio sp.]|nr:glycosyltransferase [Muribaculum sp.]MCM1551596.1 glycosyltransferase [Butyrivibrio sp.]